MRKEYWLALALAGILAMLPLGPLQLILLLTVPGFALLVLFKERFDVVELAAYSFTLSILAFPLAVLIAWFLGMWHAGAVLLGLAAVSVAAIKYRRGANIELVHSKLQWPVLGIALLIFAIVLFISLKTFTLTDAGFVCGTTHASDLNFHLSIAQRYIESPHIPVEDPYLPGHYIVYNWFMHLLMGELGVLTGIDLFTIFHVLVPLASALIFLGAYLLALFLFNSERDALVSSVVFIAASGLSWVYIAYQLFVLNNPSPDIFKEMVYEWPGIIQMIPGIKFTMMLKYDPTVLFFFLPQTQTFGLLATIFGFLLFLKAIKEKSPACAAVTGLVLASLVLFHMITAFPVFITLGLMFLYLLLRRRFDDALVAAIPLSVAFVASIYQLAIMQQGNASQIIIAHHPDVIPTILFSIGLFIPFAIYGMYLKRDDEPSWLLGLFAIINIVLLNVVELPATVNTYRFLVYAALPVSLFAGLVFSRWLVSRNTLKMAAAAVVILLMVPSTLIMVGFYNDSTYVHASTAEYEALQWIKENTPNNAVIYEEPGFFPRVPVVTGRDVAYSGEIYTLQYHNVDLQADAYGILSITDPAALYDKLSEYNVKYVFVGHRESTHPFITALKDARYFLPVYDRDGVNIYEVTGIAPQEETKDMDISPMNWIAFFAALLYLLILPGFNIVRTLGWESKLNPVELVVYVFGISVAVLVVVATLVALTFSIGLNFYTIIVPVTLIIILTNREVVSFIRRTLKV
ncbi:conserved hypothetical protein [Methanocella paludicola SANAE]|uniref:Uncharacterized protein n=1 Tax=Methanocella paludicola (strain DSM 17711 / JCM 13418 / NBRC 101707 / SANAE) TaxID=304371 RepID=D1YWJ5_METPS|nr:DUF2298 domain-containing protein [Methanocella paludicola]BAI60817.1 conserved hypothetical protein [Methanocella paludicola SANAE]